MENRTQKFCSTPLLFFQRFKHGTAPKIERKMSDLNIAFDRYASVYRHCNALHFGNKLTELSDELNEWLIHKFAICLFICQVASAKRHRSDLLVFEVKLPHVCYLSNQST